MGARPTIRLYDTLTKEKQALSPIREGQVGMYVCGPTVYDRAHIGNARPVIVFDVLFRLLNHVYGAENVTYVRNFTDIDDKIMNRAAETGEAIEAITEQTIGWYHEDMDAVGALRPTLEPRATEHVPEMIATIEALIANGAAYEAEGHVLFSVKSYEGYGQLSRRSLDDMIAGARVDVAPYKRDAMDFVLWKPSADDQPGWESPWGRGRPGWHIECSAMSEKCLGGDFDIHGGGIDLTFPHHENERAQSLCAHPGSHYASIWMHNGFVQVEGEKMSKSLGNFITVHDLAGEVPGEVIRLAMLMTHYRQPFDWTATLAAEARTVLEKWYKLIRTDYSGDDLINENDDKPQFHAVPKEIIEALSDDLNTPRAIAAMHSLFSDGRRYELFAAGALLGLFQRNTSSWSEKRVTHGITHGVNLSERSDVVAKVFELARVWDDCRKNRDYTRADEIRDGAARVGVALSASQHGPQARIDDAADPDLIEQFCTVHGIGS